MHRTTTTTIFTDKKEARSPITTDPVQALLARGFLKFDIGWVESKLDLRDAYLVR